MINFKSAEFRGKLYSGGVSLGNTEVIIMWKKYFYLCCVIVVMAIIFLFSSQNVVETNKTSDIIKKPIENVIKSKSGMDNTKEELSKKKSEDLALGVRKFAHMFLFGILAVFVLLSAKSYGYTGFKAVIITFIVCMLYACSDEWHQGFVQGRNSNVNDVFIDLIIPTLFILIERIYYIKRRKK